MANLTDIGVTAALAALSGATSIAMLNLGADTALAAVSGLGLFAVGSQLQNVAMRRRAAAAHEREMRALKRADLINADQIAQMGERTDARIVQLQAAQSERESRLASEVKVLESLLGQFAESMVRRVQALEAAHAETAGHTRRLQARLAGSAAAQRSETVAAPAANDAVLLDTVQRALIDNRVDLHLQPIVALPQRRLRFYEAFSRLRDEDGAIIPPGQYLRIAEQAGLMSNVDNLLLFRSVQFVRRLTARQKDLGVFCNISSHSLDDGAFFPQFVDFMRAHRDLAAQIVFELPQAAWEAMGEGEAAGVKALADLGFAFSMDGVTHLDFDLEAMRRRSVRYVKVAPGLLLGGAVQIAGGIRAEDLGALLARSGIALIGEKIETERQVVDLLDFAIAYGQGNLFGEPRPLREDAPEPPRAPAEAASDLSAASQPTGMAALFQARERRRATG